MIENAVRSIGQTNQQTSTNAADVARSATPRKSGQQERRPEVERHVRKCHAQRKKSLWFSPRIFTSSIN
ncbi:hypothetical protein RRG08_022922 [Elysia crispata]|uniref:Uncharacterized protein n=1 Tax=Elysia crispata TaxID=231223 RepID=A0AAE0XN52_9GAST|nr:hypothetical protein RRG08_022922 [Elysia crispata]